MWKKSTLFIFFFEGFPNDKNEIYDSHSNEEKTIFPVNKRIEHQSQSSFSDNGDIKTKYLEKLKHALYESLKQHAGKSIVLAIQLQDKGSLQKKCGFLLNQKLNF